jgi:hypothetical protein
MSMRHIFIRGLPGCTIFFNIISKNGTILEKKINSYLDVKFVYWFSVLLLWKTFLIVGRIQRDVIINVGTSLRKVPFIVVRSFSAFIIYWSDFRKKNYSNIEFHENPSSRSRVFPRGRTDRRTDMTKLTVAFRNFAIRRNSIFCCWTRGVASKAALLQYRPMEYTDTLSGKFFLLKPWKNIGGGSRGTTPLIFNVETRQMNC